MIYALFVLGDVRVSRLSAGLQELLGNEGLVDELAGEHQGGHQDCHGVVEQDGLGTVQVEEQHFGQGEVVLFDVVHADEWFQVVEGELQVEVELDGLEQSVLINSHLFGDGLQDLVVQDHAVLFMLVQFVLDEVEVGQTELLELGFAISDLGGEEDGGTADDEAVVVEIGVFGEEEVGEVDGQGGDGVGLQFEQVGHLEDELGVGVQQLDLVLHRDVVLAVDVVHPLLLAYVHYIDY